MSAESRESGCIMVDFSESDVEEAIAAFVLSGCLEGARECGISIDKSALKKRILNQLEDFGGYSQFAEVREQNAEADDPARNYGLASTERWITLRVVGHVHILLDLGLSSKIIASLFRLLAYAFLSPGSSDIGETGKFAHAILSLYKAVRRAIITDLQTGNLLVALAKIVPVYRGSILMDYLKRDCYHRASYETVATSLRKHGFSDFEGTGCERDQKRLRELIELVNKKVHSKEKIALLDCIFDEEFHFRVKPNFYMGRLYAK